MAKNPHLPQSFVNQRRFALRGCLAGTLLAALAAPHSFAQATLEARVTALKAAKKDESSGGFMKTLSGGTISGFVQGSYFYNTQDPADRHSDGYLWNTTQNSLSINKVKVTLASAPAARSGDKWDQIGETLLKIKAEGRISILLVEQYLEFCTSGGDSFAIMDRGRIVAAGSINELSDELVRTHLTV